MKKCLFVVILILVANPMAFAIGNGGVGGGDPCEKRVQTIRDDLSEWINQGGPSRGGPDGNGLKLPKGISLQDYAQRMSEFLQINIDEQGSYHEKTFIECVHHPIKVQGEEKVCRFDEYDVKQRGSKITCFYEAFMDKKTSNVDEQYRLIHHEYAGLAKLEPPNGPKSEYTLSNQIAAHLEENVIRSLAIRPTSQDENNDNEQVICTSPEYTDWSTGDPKTGLPMIVRVPYLTIEAGSGLKPGDTAQTLTVWGCAFGCTSLQAQVKSGSKGRFLGEDAFDVEITVNGQRSLDGVQMVLCKKKD